LTEELAFRSCLLAVYRLASPYPAHWKLVVFTPLAFGVAHVHHAYENWHKLGRTKAAAMHALLMSGAYQLLFSFIYLLLPPIVATLSSKILDLFVALFNPTNDCSPVAQLAYTSLFGAHCAFLFLRTGSLWPPLASHIWCNLFGLPQIGWELQVFPQNKIGKYPALKRELGCPSAYVS
jgi:prenyl protein peptidase